jgi:DNA-binding CsgD family transcriptional regulator/ketosteroid isomerase-like protein
MGSPTTERGTRSDGGVALAWLDAFNRHDIDALCEGAHPDIVLEPTEYTAPPGTIYHGRDGVRSCMRAIFDHFPAVSVESKSVREMNGVVMVEATVERGSGDSAERVILFELEDELIRRVRGYLTTSEALEAAARSARNGFHAVFDAAVEPMVLLDDGARIVDGNRAALAFLGLPPDELRERALGDFVLPAAGDWKSLWDEFLAKGRAAGGIDLTVAGHEHHVMFWATTDFAPGCHLVLLREQAEQASPEAHLLTDREREIFQLLARGLTAPKIAEQLVLSPATVRTHVQNAVTKLEATTRVQAIARAIGRGEISVE